MEFPALPEEEKEFGEYAENLYYGPTKDTGLPTLGDLKDGLPPYKRRIVDAIVPFNRRGVMPGRRHVGNKMKRGVRAIDFAELADDGYVGNPKISILVRLYAQLRLIGKSVVLWFPSPLKRSLKIDRRGTISGPGGKRILVHKYFLRQDCLTVPRLYFVKAVDSDGIPLPRKVLPSPENVKEFTFYNAYSRYNGQVQPPYPIYLSRYRVL